MINFEQFYNEYIKAITPFMEIFKLMVKCPSMKELITIQFGLPFEEELTVTQQIQFVNCFSDEIYLATEIYKALEKYKSEHTDEALTEDERILCTRVNEYYRTTFICDHDILDMSISSGDDFNMKTMKLIDRPTSTWSSYVKYLSVPRLMWLEPQYGQAQKAYVMGD